jgi:hypothetical protein
VSQEVLREVIERASRDAEFRDRLERAPDAALAGYDLTAEERTAVRNAGPEMLQALGLDQRVTKLDVPGGCGIDDDIELSPFPL